MSSIMNRRNVGLSVFLLALLVVAIAASVDYLQQLNISKYIFFEKRVETEGRTVQGNFSDVTMLMDFPLIYSYNLSTRTLTLPYSSHVFYQSLVNSSLIAVFGSAFSFVFYIQGEMNPSSGAGFEYASPVYRIPYEQNYSLTESLGVNLWGGNISINQIEMDGTIHIGFGDVKIQLKPEQTWQNTREFNKLHADSVIEFKQTITITDFWFWNKSNIRFDQPVTASSLTQYSSMIFRHAP